MSGGGNFVGGPLEGPGEAALFLFCFLAFKSSVYVVSGVIW